MPLIPKKPLRDAPMEKRFKKKKERSTPQYVADIFFYQGYHVVQIIILSPTIFDKWFIMINQNQPSAWFNSNVKFLALC